MKQVFLLKVFFILLLIIVGISVFIYLVAKKKLKWRFIFAFIIVVIGVSVIRYRINNIIFIEFREDLKEEFTYISNITVSDINPHCYLDVYLKPNYYYSYDEVKPIFIEIIHALTDEIIYNYFEQRHNKNANGEFYFYTINFINKGQDDKLIYRFRSHKENNRFVNWHLEELDLDYDINDYFDE